MLLDDILSGQTSRQKPSSEFEIDFIESPTGLGITLFPAQRVVTKLTFGTPLDYKPQKVKVWDALKETLLYELWEEDFVKYLYNEGRSNVNDWRDIPPWGFGTTVLVSGRRGGKSEVVGGIAGAVLKKLLSIYSPQEYYGLVEGSPLDFTFLGTDEKSSTRLYDKLKANIIRSPFFTPYQRSEPNATDMKFVSESDRHKRNINPSITVAAFPCTTRAVRGPSSFFLGLDEFAHFRSSKDANSDDIFEDSAASTGNFPSPDDPDRAESRILVISSPVSKIGKFYDLHKHALDLGIASNILTLRINTPTMNPRFPASKLREAYAKDPVKFEMEYAANFSDGAGSYVAPEKFNILVQDRQNVDRFQLSSVGQKYFWGLDYGTKNDATALAVGHVEMRDKGVTIVYDYIDRMMVGEPFTGPGITKERGLEIATLKELELPDILTWLVYMHKVLPCFQGLTDQHGGTTLKQLLQINGITTMDLVHLNQQINSRMYFALMGYINNATAEFPNIPKFSTEFKMLKAEYKSKYVLQVEAPQEKGAHDDMADAAALVAWQAQTYVEEHGQLDLDPTGRVFQVDPRILNPSVFVDPNTISLRDLQVRARMDRMGEGLMLPTAMPIAKPMRRY